MTRHREAARLIARYRQAVEPTSAQLDAVWRDLADPDAALRIVERRRSEPRPRGRGRAVLGGALVALAAAAAVAWWLGSTARPVTAVGDAPAVQAPHERQSGGSAGVARPGIRGVATEGGVVAPTEPRPDEGPEIHDAPAAAPTAGDLRRPEPARRPGPRARSADGLTAETALVQRAEALLREGEPARALAVLAEHARDFPRGALVIERKALRVIALCQQGVVAQGRGEAELLLRAEGSRPYRERIRRACEIE